MVGAFGPTGAPLPPHHPRSLIPSLTDFRPIPLDGEPTLLLAFDPQILTANPERAGRLMIVSDQPCEGLAHLDAETVTWREFFSPRGSTRVANFAPTRGVVASLLSATPLGVLAAMRYGVDHFHLVDAPGSSFPVNGRGAVVVVSQRVALRAVARLPLLERAGVHLGPEWPSLQDSLRGATALGEVGREALPLSTKRELRVTHYIGALGAGGAERQLTYLASETRARGHSVEVLTVDEPEGAAGHFAPELKARGVTVSGARTTRSPRALLEAGLPARLIRLLRRHVLAPQLFGLTERLRASRPDVLHCWLDQTNVLGALAGLAAGVPRIVVSTRSLSPANFPHLATPWLQASYNALGASQRVVFLNNSLAGARDYAKWTGVELARWHVVPNGFDLRNFSPPSSEDRIRRRAEFGVGPDDLLLVGVLRLSEEKMPFDLLRVVRHARERVPNLKVWHVGSGSLEQVVHAQAEAEGLLSTLTFLGRRSDALDLLSVADFSILTSRLEGCPNVAIESMSLGVPILITDGGGCPETVRHGETGFVHPVGDAEAFARSIETLALDPDLRRRLGEGGRAWVAERFGMARMVDESIALYTLPPPQ